MIISENPMYLLSNQLINPDKIFKFIGILTVTHQTLKYFGWNKQYVFYLMRKVPPLVKQPAS